MSKVKCKECGEVMSSADWQVHDCPMIPHPREGESWMDYQARCKEFKANIIKEQEDKR